MTVRQEVSSGQNESVLFAMIDGIRASTEGIATSISHFDECDLVSIEHH